MYFVFLLVILKRQIKVQSSDYFYVIVRKTLFISLICFEQRAGFHDFRSALYNVGHENTNLSK